MIGCVIVALLLIPSSLPAENSHLLIEPVSSTPNEFRATILPLTADTQELQSGTPASFTGYSYDNSVISITTCYASGTPVTIHADANIHDEPGSAGDSYRQCSAAVGDPFLFRGLYLYPVHIHATVDDSTNPVSISNVFELTLHFPHGDNTGVTGDPVPVTAESRAFLESHLMNIDEINLYEAAPYGRLLILMQNNESIINTMQPYIRWKHEQGYQVAIETLNNVNSRNLIASLIEAHYEIDTDIPLEYVLLVGDADGSVMVVPYNETTDNPYVQMNTGNQLPNIAIGRFSVRNLTQLQRVVNKTIAYERDVYTSDPSWLGNAVLTAGAGSGISPIFTNRSIKWMMQREEITTDTLWFTMQGDIPTFIVDRVNQGAAFVNYRGLQGMDGWSPSCLGDFTNGSRLPVMTTITCGTGDFGTEVECISEGMFRAGSGINTFGGAVACIGTSTADTHTRFNNVIDASFYEALLFSNIRSTGWALVHAKTRLYEAYAETDDDPQFNDYIRWNNLMGDPALRMWSNIPESITVQHSHSISEEENYLDIIVSGIDPDGRFIAATVSDDEEIHDSQRILPNGTVRLLLDSDRYNDADSLCLTITGDNIIPYQARIAMQNNSNGIGFDDVILTNSPSGYAHPGEELFLEITVRNYGSAPSESVTVEISSQSDPRLEIEEGYLQNISVLQPGETCILPEPVVVQVAPWTNDGALPSLTLICDGDVENSSAIPVPVRSWTAVSGSSPHVLGDDGIAMPGQSQLLRLEVENAGSIPAQGLTGFLESNSPNLVITDPQGYYGSLATGAGIENENDPFGIYITNLAAVGERASMTLILTDSIGAVDTVQYHLYIAHPGERGAVGPDEYGYWALDNQDNPLDFYNVPEYEWLDIADIGSNLHLEDNAFEDDKNTVITLPFEFQYYGETYSQLTICTNGWAAFGEWPTMLQFRNWPIPNPLGPPGMLAVFWDDLLTMDGGVYTYYNVSEGKFIVQWDCVTAFDYIPQEFQLVLFDPGHWPTHTGNGVIQYHYNNINPWMSEHFDNDYVTVGIESPDQQDGVMYCYWQQLSEGAEPLEDHLSILFTDDLSGNAANAPSASIEPDYFIFEMQPNESSTQSLRIANHGGSALTWHLYVFDEILLTGNVNTLSGLTIPANHNPEFMIGPNLPDNMDFKESLSTVVPEDKPTSESGGPDNYGYYWRDMDEPNGPDFQWHDDYGSVIESFSIDADDGMSAPIDLPFDFPYYSEEYNRIWVCSNGFITVIPGQTPSWANRTLPSVNAPLGMIAAWWDDLDISDGGNAYYYDNGLDMAVITFEAVPGWGQRGGPYTFQTILFSDGNILFQYLDMGYSDDERHDESTIGIQDSNGTDGLTILNNDPSGDYIRNEFAILVRSTYEWVSVTPAQGITDPNHASFIAINAASEQMPTGQYYASLLVSTNDPDIDSQTIPVLLNITGDNEAPVLEDIPNQAIIPGDSFEIIHLNDYAEDPNYEDAELSWNVIGQDELQITIENGMATIDPPSSDWLGSETVFFTVENPDGGVSCDGVTFTANYDILPPGPFSLVNPEYGDTLSTPHIFFRWEQSEDPEGSDVLYTLYFASNGDTVFYAGLPDCMITLDLDTIGIELNIYESISWWVEAEDAYHHSTLSNQKFTLRLSGLYTDPGHFLPGDFSIGNPYPNPFNPQVNLTVELPVTSDVHLTVYNILGRIAAQQEYRQCQPGTMTISWSEPTAASGVYFMRIQAGPLQETRKAILMR